MYLIENSFKQHDPEWFDARLDSIGGTDISKIITTKGERSKSRDDFLTDKASQIITRKTKPVFATYEMKWGNENEPRARKVFEFVKDIKLSECAMIFYDGKRNWHISPDGFNEKLKVGWETKCPQLKEFRKTVKDNKLPTKHILQVQTSLAVTGWDSWWFMSFFPELKPFMIEVQRDEDLIKIIKAEINIFIRDLNNLIKKLRS